MFAEDISVCDGARLSEGVELVHPLLGHIEVHKAIVWHLHDLLRFLSRCNHVFILLSENTCIIM